MIFKRSGTGSADFLRSFQLLAGHAVIPFKKFLQRSVVIEAIEECLDLISESKVALEHPAGGRNLKHPFPSESITSDADGKVCECFLEFFL